MGTIVHRLNQRWVRAVTTGVMGAAMVTGIFILAGGQISERVFLVPLIFSGTIAIAATLVLPWVERAETRLNPGAQRLVVAITFIGIAALGALAAGGLVLATGIVPTEQSWYVMTSGLGIALLVAMLLFTHEMARERRARAERALEAEAARRQQAERLATEARLASLESRLQPHFLRNALNTIAHHVVADPPRAEELLEQLAALLGASLERTTRRTVPLREEIRMVWDYLDIEQAQLGERLRWQLESLREVHGYEVPPFSLQSLVHNSVKHVAARRPDGAEIRVQTGLRDGQLVVSVWDDGPGFDLASVPKGHGLDTLRLQLRCPVRAAGGVGGPARGGRHPSGDAAPGVGGREEPGMSTGRPLRAYLVDDIETANLRLAQVLTETGRVEVVGSTTQPRLALAEIPERDVDVVFLDIEMPGLDGFDVLERLGERTRSHLRHRIRAVRAASL